MLERQRAEIEAFMRQSMDMSTSAGLPLGPRFTLKKLPMYGYQVEADAINFEWPTQEMVDQWPENASLKSIELSTYMHGGDAVLSTAKCILTTSEQSPFFEAPVRGDFPERK